MSVHQRFEQLLGDSAVETINTQAATEAVTSLGYLKPSSVPLISSMIDQIMVVGARQVTLNYRRSEPQITAEQKKQAFIGANTLMSVSAFEDLTLKGLSVALEAHQRTLFRAWQSSIRLRCKASFQGDMTFSFRNTSCRTCMALYNTTVASRDAPGFPPAACEEDVCMVMLRPEIDFMSGLRENLTPDVMSMRTEEASVRLAMKQEDSPPNLMSRLFGWMRS